MYPEPVNPSRRSVAVLAVCRAVRAHKGEGQGEGQGESGVGDEGKDKDKG